MKKDLSIAKNFIDEEFSETMRRALEGEIRPKNKARLMEYVLKNKAWNDTIIYEKKKSGSPILKNKDVVCDTFIEEMKKLDDDYIDYQSWHESALKRLAEDYFGSKYGMAQKYINMSIKYIYFLELVYGVELFDISLKEFERDFDVPIDSFILKWVIYNSVTDSEFVDRAGEISSWNKMDSNTYFFIQEKTKELLRKKYGNAASILIAETLIWSGIKDLKSKINMEL
ncbi:MAG: hypothetical protein K6G30_13025 [Acetatifactor sp.]|nr:hypothetical protein [Acetatifactor sp.]